MNLIAARCRVLYASSVTAQLSTGRPVRVLSVICSGVASGPRIRVLLKAAKPLRIKGVPAPGAGGTCLERLKAIIRAVDAKLAVADAKVCGAAPHGVWNGVVSHGASFPMWQVRERPGAARTRRPLP